MLRCFLGSLGAPPRHGKKEDHEMKIVHRTGVRSAFSAMILFCALLWLTGCAGSVPSRSITSLADIAGTWTGRSTSQTPIKLVVTSTTAEFYFNGEKMAMKEPQIANGVVTIGFKYDSTGFIRATARPDGNLEWDYSGLQGVSHSVMAMAEKK